MQFWDFYPLEKLSHRRRWFVDCRRAAADAEAATAVFADKLWQEATYRTSFPSHWRYLPELIVDMP